MLEMVCLKHPKNLKIHVGRCFRNMSRAKPSQCPGAFIPARESEQGLIGGDSWQRKWWFQVRALKVRRADLKCYGFWIQLLITWATKACSRKSSSKDLTAGTDFLRPCRDSSIVWKCACLYLQGEKKSREKYTPKCYHLFIHRVLVMLCQTLGCKEWKLDDSLARETNGGKTSTFYLIFILLYVFHGVNRYLL